MHPRNPYRVPPDFVALSNACPALAPYLRHNQQNQQIQLDWSDTKALIELCRALLFCDFGVRWTLPEQNLCPTVPSRLNYLLWIEDLLALSAMSTSGQVTGVDIGTGASCIYPLLGVAHFGWKFIATELDPDSVVAARHNVSLNRWQDKIEVRQVTTSVERRSAESCLPSRLPTSQTTQDKHASPILCGVLQCGDDIQFCMCNPPFFDFDEMPLPNAATRPHARCAATQAEQFTPGGEVGFISQLVAESTQLREKVLWYTSLVGRKASLRPILRSLRAASVAHIRTTEIAQGQTWRWAIAWSFVPAAAPVMLTPDKPASKVFYVTGLSVSETRARIFEYLRAAGAGVDVEETRSLPSQHETEERSEMPTEPPPMCELLIRGRLEPSSLGSDARASSEDVRSHARVNTKKRVAGESLDHPASGTARAVHICRDGFCFRVELSTQALAVDGQSEQAHCHSLGATTASDFLDDVDGLWMTVTLEASVMGFGSAAFWRFAEQLRNDVVRDTRKWRRQRLAAD